MVSRRPHLHDSVDEHGAGAVLGVAMVMVLVVVTLAAATCVAIFSTHRAAQAAADLSALAAAGAAQDGRDPCRVAARAALRNHGVLERCQVDGWEVEVTVGVDTGELVRVVPRISARARAGPVSLAPG